MAKDKTCIQSNWLFRAYKAMLGGSFAQAFEAIADIPYRVDRAIADMESDSDDVVDNIAGAAPSPMAPLALEDMNVAALGEEVGLSGVEAPFDLEVYKPRTVC